MIKNNNCFYLKLDKQFNIEYSSNMISLTGNLFDYIDDDNFKKLLNELNYNDVEFHRVSLHIDGSVFPLNAIAKAKDNNYYISFYKEHYDKYLQSNEYINNFIGIHFDYDIATKKLIKLSKGDVDFIQDISLDRILDESTNIFEIDPEMFDEFRFNMLKVFLYQEKETFYFKSKFRNSEYHWYSLEILAHDASIKGLSRGQIHNIDIFAKDREILLKEGSIDQLSGVLNKKSITNYATDLFKSNPKKKFELIILDIDYFKSINDTYGHLFGDKVISNLAQKLMDTVSTNGKIGRIGGDEFLIVLNLKDDEYSTIKAIGQSLRLAASKLEVDNIPNFLCSITLGMSSYPKDGLSYEELFKKADKALYRGKNKGRDCYIIYDEEKHGTIKSDDETPLYVYEKQENKNNYTSDSNFLSRILDNLIQSTNLREAIGTALEEIGNFFHLDRIILAKKNKQILFQYANKGIKKLDYYYDIIDSEGYLDLFSNNNTYFVNSFSVSKAQCGSEIDRFYLKNNNKSMVQVALFDGNNLDGFISYEMCHEKRVWQRSELMHYTILGKILSTFSGKIPRDDQMNLMLYQDPITKFNNYSSFKQIISKNNIMRKKYVFLMIDIKNFRNINERFGFAEGDIVLASVAHLINKRLAEDETFCRTSDDRFLLAVKFVNQNELFNVFEELFTAVNALGNKFTELFNLEILGGAYILEEGVDFATAMYNANIARKYAKTQSNRRLALYDEQIKKIQNRNKIIEDRMNYALENNEFVIYLQPCYFIKTNTIASMEALVRWQFGDTLMLPDDFIPLFEKNGFISKLDFFVYEEVCKVIRRWLDMGKDICPISVNVSRCHLIEQDFIRNLCTLLEKYDIEKKYVGLELTESLFMDNQIRMLEFVREIKENGFRIYMDDFGVAYSTLSLLSQIPVDVIKLDRAFFNRDYFDDRERIIVSNIIRMSKELGIRVLSEGIETSSQLEELVMLECDYAQGFYFFKPLSITEIEEKKLF